MHSPSSIIAVFNGEFVVQLTEFSMTANMDDTFEADIQMMGYDAMQQFNRDMIDYIHVTTERKRYDFSDCYIISNTTQHSTRADEPLMVDMTIKSLDVKVHERV